MKRAAEMEAATYKHPITPGNVLPARELLADLLLEIGKPARALAEYQISLQRTPRRFNSLFGVTFRRVMTPKRKKCWMN